LFFFFFFFVFWGGGGGVNVNIYSVAAVHITIKTVIIIY
jgi:hypothetical protein